MFPDQKTFWIWSCETWYGQVNTERKKYENPQNTNNSPVKVTMKTLPKYPVTGDDYTQDKTKERRLRRRSREEKENTQNTGKL